MSKDPLRYAGPREDVHVDFDSLGCIDVPVPFEILKARHARHMGKLRQTAMSKANNDWKQHILDAAHVTARAHWVQNSGVPGHIANSISTPYLVEMEVHYAGEVFTRSSTYAVTNYVAQPLAHNPNEVTMICVRYKHISRAASALPPHRKVIHLP